MKRRILFLILIFTMLFTLQHPVLADQISTSIISETGDITLERFDVQSALLSINNQQISDEAKIVGIVELFSHAKIYQLENFIECIDFSSFFDFNTGEVENLSYMCDKIELEQKMRERCNATVIWSELEIEIEDIVINNDYAEVKAYELYRYTRPSTPDIVAGEGVHYLFVFNKINEMWYITDLTTDSSFDNVMREIGLNVNDYVAKANIQVESASLSEYLGPDISTFSTTGWTFYSLDADEVATYANYYAHTSNPLFYDYTGRYDTSGNPLGDCQNYASQCIWAGLGGVESSSAIDNKSWPMIDDGTHNRGWFHLSTWNRDKYNHWASVTSFASYVAGGGSQTWGLVGTVTAGIANASYGDIIQVGDSEHGGYYHSFIVVAHSGTAGSRTSENLWVAGHTDDMSYKHFLEVYSSENYYRTIHVTGSWKGPSA